MENQKVAATWVDIETLIPWTKNPRINDQAVEHVKQSIKRFGFASPIIARTEDNRVIAGHTRLKAAQVLGLSRVPVRFLNLDEQESSLLALADNKLGELADWDEVALAEILKDLQEEQADLDGLGWDDSEIDDLINSIEEPTEGLTDPDEIPEPPEEPITKTGDLWQLGNHRLLCGDSTKAEDVDRLMGGKKAEMVYTDPPYGVNYEGGTKKQTLIANDENNEIYAEIVPVLIKNTSSSAAFYVWYSAGFADAAQSIERGGLKIRSQIVWNKNLAQFGALSAQYKQKHEPMFYCHKPNKSPKWYGPTNEITVWDCDRAPKNEFHPTQKPTALCVRAMNNSSKTKDSVLDLFGGSGSTLIACEQTNRKCFMMELSPSYCDVIIKRWESFTGKKAELVSSNG